MLISSEHRAEFLQELLGLQHFINNCDGPANITSKVVEDSVALDYEDGIDKPETAHTEVFDYNETLAHKICDVMELSSFEKVELERLCRNRVSRQYISNEILGNRSKFLSKVDKFIVYPGSGFNDRFTAKERSIITISSNYSWNGEAIKIHTAITINTIHDYSLPTLQQLFNSISI